MLTAVVVLLIINVAVFIHELAHYVNARSVGLPVRAFSIGMGPILWRRSWRGTEWRLSLLPIGGYVDLPGLAAEPDSTGNLRTPEHGFVKLKLWQKLWVLIGGVVANFILAVLLVAAVIVMEPGFRTMTAGVTVPTATTFVQVLPDTPAEALGIEPGDVILEVSGIENPTVEEVHAQIRQDGPLSFVLDRDGNIVTVETHWAPEPAEDGSRPLLGVSIGAVPIESISYPAATVEATSFLARLVPEAVRGFTRAVGQTFTGQRTEEVAGPVRIVGAIGEAARIGLAPVLFLAGVINFSLAVFNLLPIPGLDGGRILLSIIIAIRGRPFRPGQEEFIHFLGFVAIIAFVLLLTFGEVGELLTR
jgi:regulator of sigma E protease